MESAEAKELGKKLYDIASEIVKNRGKTWRIEEEIMEQQTALEDNYSGLVEKGFEYDQAIVDWGEQFYDHIELHRDSEMDVTISAKSAAWMQEEFDDGDITISSIIEELNVLRIESECLVLRFPNGLKNAGSEGFSKIGKFPDYIVRIYLPPTYSGELELTDENKDIFVVPSNFTYKTGDNKAKFKTYQAGNANSK